MTDTTDIKAVSYARLIEVRNILSGFEDGYDTVADRENYEAMRDAQASIDELISLRGKLRESNQQLEAERQRADEGAKEITYWCNLNARKNERMGELEAAEKERDEITTGILELIPDCRYMDPPDGGSVTPLEQLSRMVTELRAAPQKPVVLPKEIEPWEVIDILDPTANPEDYACCVGADMYNAAIKACRESVQAAGGIVKDGE